MLVIPAIDLRQGLCVRLKQGRKEDVTVYPSEPVQVVRQFQESGARWLHVVDLDGAFSDPNSRNREVLREIINAVEMKVQFGGGLRSLADIAQALDLGVSRVVLGTLAVKSPVTVTEALKCLGSDRIAVGIDANDGRVMTHGWKTENDLSALEMAQRMAQLGVERIVYTDVARDGMLSGVNLEQTCMIARESGLKVTASGGVASLDDIARVSAASACGIDSVIIGKALYEGRFTLAEAIREAD